MKNIIKYIAIFSVIFTLTSCDEKEWLAPDIEATSVYSITDITGFTAVKINVYKEKPLIIEYATSVALKNYTSSTFVDASTDTTISFSVNKVTADGTVSYSVTADKITGVGSLTVDGATVYAIKVSDIQLYN